MNLISDDQLRQLSRLLPWQDGSCLPDGRILGRGRKDLPVQAADRRIALLVRHLQPAGWRVLELGSCEAVHTVQLAAHCASVVGVEARVRNVLCGLVRLWVHGVENARLVLGDVEQLDASAGRFDIVCHIGVLYHLTAPAAHLRRVRPLAPVLFLDTHYVCDPSRMRRCDETCGGQRYRGYEYRERRYATDPFSGIRRFSRWFDRDSLLDALRDAGYATTEVLDDRMERFGPRISLIARTADAAAA